MPRILANEQEEKNEKQNRAERRTKEDEYVFAPKILLRARADFQDALKWRRAYAAKHLRRLHAS